MTLPHSLVRIVDKLLADRVSDPALIAHALMPPDAGYVAAQEPVVDPEGVTAARAFVKRAIGTALRGSFERVYDERRVRATYAPTNDQTGARRLANMCLRYLAAIDGSVGARASPLPTTTRPTT